MRKRTLVASAIGALALVLTGCSSGDSESSESSDTTQQSSDTKQDTQTQEDTDETTEEAEGSGGASQDATEPGAELSLGDTATVLYPDTDDGKQMIKVSVTDITKASKSDFKVAGKKFLKKIEDYTPYYVTMDVEKLKPFNVELDGKTPTDGVFAFDDSDDRVGPINMIGNFEPCEDNQFDDEHDTGTSLSTCLIFAVPQGKDLGSVAWAPNDTDYNYFDGKPIKWTS